MSQNTPLNYIERLNSEMKPKNTHGTLIIDLFAGCGGLALGFEAQGFKTIGFEMNPDCCMTYNNNLTGECIETFLTTETELPKTKVIIGGPPCQPFSVGGNQKGHADDRNGFPAYISAVRRIKPDIFLFENVRGLLYKNKWYFDRIISELEQLGYIVEARLLNAIDYGVPQNRERVIVIGHHGKFRFPKSMLYRVSAGEALGEFAFDAPAESKFLTPNMDAYIAKYEKASCCINPRDMNLDRPARTLTCRNLAGATGDMQRIKLPDGRRRRLLQKEAARIQSFPDWFKFSGGEESVYNQIGNAVPPYFAYHLARSVLEYLESGERLSSEEIASRRTQVQASLFDSSGTEVEINEA